MSRCLLRTRGSNQSEKYLSKLHEQLKNRKPEDRGESRKDLTPTAHNNFGSTPHPARVANEGL